MNEQLSCKYNNKKYVDKFCFNNSKHITYTSDCLQYNLLRLLMDY